MTARVLHAASCIDGIILVAKFDEHLSRHKFTFDKSSWLFKLTKVMPSGLVFPMDFGFIPNTKADDGDPIDVLVVVEQGTYPGWLLDGNRLRVSGWTDAAFTASSDPHDQLPMGFNYRANEYHVQQAWVRFERPVDQTASTPTFAGR